MDPSSKMPKTPIRHKERLIPGGALPWGASSLANRLRTAGAAQAGPDARGLWGSHVCRAGLCVFVCGRTPVQWGCLSLCACAPPCTCSPLCVCVFVVFLRPPQSRGRSRPTAALPQPGPAPPPPGPCPAPPLRRRDPGLGPAHLRPLLLGVAEEPGPAAVGRGKAPAAAGADPPRWQHRPAGGQGRAGGPGTPQPERSRVLSHPIAPPNASAGSPPEEGEPNLPAPRVTAGVQQARGWR